MKKIKTILSLLFIMTFSICLCGCKKSAKKEETVMNLSCNPSVEFILDKDNKVLSVTALNEDGNIIVAGETFVGLTAEEAAELFVKVAKETGFIVNGSLSTDQNNIEVSISGDTTKAKNLYTKVKGEMKDFLDSNNIIASFEQTKAISLTEIKQLVKENYNNLTDEQINKLNQSELITYLKEAREQTKDFYSQGLKDAYAAMKEQEADSVKNVEILEIVAQYGTEEYQTVVNQYLDAVNAVEAAKGALKNARYNYLISAESIYQTKLQELNAAKDELVTKRNEIAAMEEGVLKETAKASLTLLETALTTAQTAYEAQYAIIDTALDTAIATLNSAQDTLNDMLENLPNEIKTAIENNSQEINEAFNTAKENTLNNFKQLYEDEIKSINDAILNRKVELELAVLNSYGN